MYEQKVRMMNIDELISLMKENKNFLLIDARPRDMYDEEHLPNARSIPVEDIPTNANSLDKDQLIVTYCGSYECQASTAAAKEFTKLGFKNVRDYKGGIQEWKEKGNRVESTKKS